ncbi:MAG: Fe-S-cluster-containing hydrogenase [Bacteroidetes bacterium]|jgi:Fe-S-cluster-containing dehydrogenase component/anaerobic selenocysteine-containing dehydrogenase|nr:Fe-S-cluster-containing hydrogenase [Bacteroidota bacterium]
MEPKYFRSLEELKIDTRTASIEKPAGDRQFIFEMQQELKKTTTASRRDFLKVFGFTVASAAIASSCEQPVRKAIPLLIQPEETVPGKASYYASTFFDGIDYCPVVVKVRDGRPIKIEGNKLSSITQGGTNARTQASVLGLYDNARYKEPAIKGSAASWQEVDEAIVDQLNAIKQKGGKIVLLSGSIISPSTLQLIDEFFAEFPGEHITYDVLSASAMRQANLKTFGQAFVPDYRFDKAEVIVAFDADFLGSWLSPVAFTKQYSKNRKLTDGQQKMSRHIHLEGAMSLTGSNADERIQLHPAQEKETIAALLYELGQLDGRSSGKPVSSPVDVKKIARELYSNKGKALVVVGTNDPESQLMVNAINEILGSYGNTIITDVHLKLRKGDDAAMERLVEEMNGGKVDALLLYDVNPAYDYPQKDKFLSGLQKVALKVAMPVYEEETAALADFICPDHHYLEAWNDAEVKTGYYSLAQPAIRPIFNTRAVQSSLLKWLGKETDFRTYIQAYWEENLYEMSENLLFTSFWNKKLHDGIFDSGRKEAMDGSFDAQAALAVQQTVPAGSADQISLVVYPNVAVGTGKHANNPWLQELPDPVSKACWDNYISISPRLAGELGLEDNDTVDVAGIGELPILIQPGQEYKTLAVAMGYGREKAGIPATGVGKNVFGQLGFANGNRQFVKFDVALEKLGGTYEVARTQSHHSMEGRAIVRETTLADYKENPISGNEIREEIKKHLKTLYPKQVYDGFHWGMAVDLNSCTGCNACVVACSAENNVPVVGKEQVLMAREMHWIRIDRYYKGDENNPEVVRQPVTCQHCDNAPCENVCPVAATTHSNEGLNQMAYNRCIGTRYCNNNCPYKVRRFNFFDYTGADTFKGNRKDPAEMTTDLRRMVLNPDVTVRAKGVIEKCSFCVQRIQDKKLQAKNENRQLRDGEVVPACAQACPSEAIVFGNLNDKNSKIAKYFADDRNYHLLEELHTLPSVGYLTKVKNTTV